MRRDFEEYLRRPDGKQEFLAAWQQEYNDIAEDMRDDEETRSELHQRVMVSTRDVVVERLSSSALSLLISPNSS